VWWAANGAGGNGASGDGASGNGASGNGSTGDASLSDVPKEVRANVGTIREGGRFGIGMPVERSENFGHSARRLFDRLRPERLKIYSVVALAIVSVSLAVSGPKILARGTNLIVEGMTSGKGIDFTQLHQVLFLALLVYVTSNTLQYIQSYILAGVVQRSMQKLRSDVEDKLNRLPLWYIDRQPRGDLLSRVTNDIDNVAQSLQQTLSMMLTSVLSLVGVLIMMYTISWLLATITIVIVPCSLLIMRAITTRSKKRFISQWLHTGVLNGHVEETFTGLALVQVFGRQDDVQDVFDAENEELYEASFWAQFISGAVQPVMMFVGNLNYVIIAVVGGLRVASGQMTVGDIQAFIQYSRQFTQPLTQLASMVNLLQSGIASAERVFEFLDEDEETPDPVEPVFNHEPQGRIEFANVAFSYDPDKPLITDLSLLAEPGATIAIVGPTGAGKTTLVNLIMRFYNIDDGTITLDGHDTSQMRRDELRGNIGMVLQDTWLFEGTIRENIAFGNPDATEEQMIEAAKATHVDWFVRSLPDGYDTRIDDEGNNVSAGEKQLLTIARAFLADPTILILDEATSSVDTRTEVLIQQAMAALRTNRTSFVIAHRLSTIRDADTILVMEHGDIVEQGNHEELLARGGAYATLYNAQFAGAATEIE
jgi:ATP-binding cassette subfamily B protein